MSNQIPLSQRLDLLFVLWCKSADSPAPYADIAAEVSRRTGMVLTADEVEDIRCGHRLPDPAVAIAIAEALGWDEPSTFPTNRRSTSSTSTISRLC